MTIFLSFDGWENDGIPLGIWTQQANLVGVTQSLGIVSIDVEANTLAGDDQIVGKGGFGVNFGILLQSSTLETGNGNDNIIGEGVLNFSSPVGIRLVDSTLDTGNGDDQIVARGGSNGLSLTGISHIDTGNGNDYILGESFVGIVINPASVINTGNGDDYIIGKGGLGSGGIGISLPAGSLIKTGRGNDSVDVLLGGITGAGIVDLGQGDDLFKGAASTDFTVAGAPSIEGGKGYDTLVLPSGNYDITLGQGSVIVAQNGFEMIVRNFELLTNLSGSIALDITSLSDTSITIS